MMAAQKVLLNWPSDSLIVSPMGSPRMWNGKGRMANGAFQEWAGSWPLRPPSCASRLTPRILRLASYASHLASRVSRLASRVLRLAISPSDLLQNPRDVPVVAMDPEDLQAQVVEGIPD